MAVVDQDQVVNMVQLVVLADLQLNQFLGLKALQIINQGMIKTLSIVNSALEVNGSKQWSKYKKVKNFNMCHKIFNKYLKTMHDDKLSKYFHKWKKRVMDGQRQDIECLDLVN